MLQRTLPVPGEILVEPGQMVEALTVVARSEIPSRYRVIEVARQLNRPHVTMNEIMLVAPGDEVEDNQVIATLKGDLPFLQRSIRAPIAGRIATIGPGWVLLETERTTLEIQAFIKGRVNRILSDRGVVVEAQGSIIEAACGFGGEAHGRLRRLVNSPYETLKTETIDENVRETIVLGGRTVDEEALRAAERWQVRGIVVGSIQASLLKLEPPVRVRVVATEGFGNVPMSAHTFSILTSLSRKEISIRGQTPILRPFSGRQSVVEPPIIVAADTSGATGSRLDSPLASPDRQKIPEVKLGSQVRVIQGRLLGATGTVATIPSDPQATEAGIIAPGAVVKFREEVHYVPWTNLEQVV